MACCGREPVPVTELKNSFEKIFINIGKSKLEFIPEERYGVFKLKEENGRENTNREKMIEKQQNLEEELKKKNDRIEYLKKTLEEMDEKIAQLDMMLNIAATEKEYILFLGRTNKNESQKDN